MFLILPPVTIRAPEYARLAEIARRACTPRRMPAVADVLLYELSRAQVAPPDAVLRDVVTMNSRFECRDVELSRTFRHFLTYPGEEHLHPGGISVLSPLGAAAIGLRVGSTIPWKTPTGEPRTLKILRVLEKARADWQWPGRLFRSNH